MTEVVRNADIDFSLTEKLIDILPGQGCIELQQDGPGKVHDWHRHDNEEVLIVLKGEMTFSIDDADFVCGPGDALRLSANERHRSQAGPEGSVYVIAFRDLDIRPRI